MNNEEVIEKIEMLITLHDQNPEIECCDTLTKISEILEIRYKELNDAVQKEGETQ